MPTPRQTTYPSSSRRSTGATITLWNPSYTRTTVHYTIDGKAYTMPPGYKQVLSASRSRLIEFHRGGYYGKQEYSLTSGVYYFAGTRAGWELYGR